MSHILQIGVLDQDGLLTISSVQEWILGLEVRDGLAPLPHYLKYNCPQLFKQIKKKAGSYRTPPFYIGKKNSQVWYLKKIKQLDIEIDPFHDLD